MKQENMLSEKTAKPKSEKSLTISELAKRHQNDPNHTTSDEELRNAKLELTGDVVVDNESLYEVDNTTVFPPMDFEKDLDEQKEQAKDEAFDKANKKEDKLPNPYDVLG